MFNFEFEFVVQRDLYALKRTLNYKTEGFPELQKETSGYYYLIDLINKIPSLKFKNESEFYRNLNFIIQEFPVMNNGKIGYGDYINYLVDFQDYIRKEFGLLPKNRILWRRFLAWLVFLFCFITIMVKSALVGGISGFILAIILARSSEKRWRKKGLILGVKEKQ